MLARTSTQPETTPPDAPEAHDTPDARDARPLDDAAIVIDRATVRFPDQLAVDDLSLVVPAGSILGLIGPSGAGKTTTIRLLTGALVPTVGRVTVLGEEPKSFRRQTRERIGYMPQSFMLYPDLTVRENVDFVGSLFGMLFRSRRRRTRQVLDLVDLWSVRGRRAGKLSGGMQRRLELACVLVHDPAVLFLDEPTSGIDPLLRGHVWDELHRLRDDGRTLLITTQHLDEAETCDHVAMIAGGRLIELGAPDELRRRAFGGDVVEVETDDPFDGEGLRSLPFVRGVRQDGPRKLTITVDEAGTGTPDVVEAIQGQGGEVASAREERPTFDLVFATLVGRAATPSTAPEPSNGDAELPDDERPPERPRDDPEPPTSPGQPPAEPTA